MAAQWRLLTAFLRKADGDVYLTWQEFDAIVGGIPASAVDHFPQWWSGARSHTNAWRAAGYEATDIRPGASVRFVRRRGSTPPSSPSASARHPGSTPSHTRHTLANPTLTVGELPDPSTSLIVVPCSARKRLGGLRSGRATSANAALEDARRDVLARANADEERLMPAWQRYDGNLYRAVGPRLRKVAHDGRLLILSGGYGVLDGRDQIGTYNKMMKTSDWPKGLLEEMIAARAAGAGLDVVAFAAASTDYAKVLRRVSWDLPGGRAACLVTMHGLVGTSAVSNALGLACRAFMEGTST